MTFAELQARASELYELTGFADTKFAPDWADMVNRAWQEFAWSTEVNRESDTVASVADQSVYDLDRPVYKLLTDVLYDDEPLDKNGEATLRREDPYWLTATSGTPRYWWRPTPVTIRLYPAPDTTAKTITVYGIRGVVAMDSDDDEPTVADEYHEAIAKRAAWMAAERFARGEERQSLLDQAEQYSQYLSGLKGVLTQEHVLHRRRHVPYTMPEQVALI